MKNYSPTHSAEFYLHNQSSAESYTPRARLESDEPRNRSDSRLSANDESNRSTMIKQTGHVLQPHYDAVPADDPFSNLPKRSMAQNINQSRHTSSPRQSAQLNSEDLVDLLQAEQRRDERKEKCRRVRHQIGVFCLSFIRYLIISILQGGLTFYRPQFHNKYMQLHESLIFGLLLIGNTLDNLAAPKWIAIGSQVSLATFWVLTGGIVQYDVAHPGHYEEGRVRGVDSLTSLANLA